MGLHKIPEMHFECPVDMPCLPWPCGLHDYEDGACRKSSLLPRLASRTCSCMSHGMTLSSAHPGHDQDICKTNIVSRRSLNSLTRAYTRTDSSSTLVVQTLQYVWVEGWSEDYQRPFFYNQESKQSSWDRPPDLAWQRIALETQEI